KLSEQLSCFCSSPTPTLQMVDSRKAWSSAFRPDRHDHRLKPELHAPSRSAALLKLLEEVELLFEQMVAHLNYITKIHVRLVAGVVLSPLRETFAVGIFCLRKIHPVVRHRLSKLVIYLAKAAPTFSAADSLARSSFK